MKGERYFSTKIPEEKKICFTNAQFAAVQGICAKYDEGRAEVVRAAGQPVSANAPKYLPTQGVVYVESGRNECKVMRQLLHMSRLLGNKV